METVDCSSPTGFLTISRTEYLKVRFCEIIKKRGGEVKMMDPKNPTMEQINEELEQLGRILTQQAKKLAVLAYTMGRRDAFKEVKETNDKIFGKSKKE
jgi:hypothetical protein